ncbi:hypothetical protein RZA67_15625 [Stenotrophomonas sp. C3(2023)]|uniref:hypothetical protein n=1 Tax=Stenotrophomonas sp. C3(2023) TaxID=3080277 RepID=UPI00293C17C3|nr:hypothetical protein [Stenotrophomonas sp. C3(2023)]MDV3470153.1 hypothetical protein [Stenotrophomonas sp. C3(2023)]
MIHDVTLDSVVRFDGKDDPVHGREGVDVENDVILIYDNGHYDAGAVEQVDDSLQFRVAARMPADGDCLFHAVLHSLPELLPPAEVARNVRMLRGHVADYMSQHMQAYAPFLGQDGPPQALTPTQTRQLLVGLCGLGPDASSRLHTLTALCSLLHAARELPPAQRSEVLDDADVIASLVSAATQIACHPLDEAWKANVSLAAPFAMLLADTLRTSLHAAAGSGGSEAVVGLLRRDAADARSAVSELLPGRGMQALQPLVELIFDEAVRLAPQLTQATVSTADGRAVQLASVLADEQPLLGEYPSRALPRTAQPALPLIGAFEGRPDQVSQYMSAFAEVCESGKDASAKSRAAVRGEPDPGPPQWPRALAGPGADAEALRQEMQRLLMPAASETDRVERLTLLAEHVYELSGRDLADRRLILLDRKILNGVVNALVHNACYPPAAVLRTGLSIAAPVAALLAEALDQTFEDMAVTAEGREAIAAALGADPDQTVFVPDTPLAGLLPGRGMAALEPLTTLFYQKAPSLCGNGLDDTRVPAEPRRFRASHRRLRKVLDQEQPRIGIYPPTVLDPSVLTAQDAGGCTSSDLHGLIGQVRQTSGFWRTASIRLAEASAQADLARRGSEIAAQTRWALKQQCWNEFMQPFETKRLADQHRHDEQRAMARADVRQVWEHDAARKEAASHDERVRLRTQCAVEMAAFSTRMMAQADARRHARVQQAPPPMRPVEGARALAVEHSPVAPSRDSPPRPGLPGAAASSPHPAVLPGTADATCLLHVPAGTTLIGQTVSVPVTARCGEFDQQGTLQATWPSWERTPTLVLPHQTEQQRLHAELRRPLETRDWLAPSSARLDTQRGRRAAQPERAPVTFHPGDVRVTSGGVGILFNRGAEQPFAAVLPRGTNVSFHSESGTIYYRQQHRALEQGCRTPRSRPGMER